MLGYYKITTNNLSKREMEMAGVMIKHQISWISGRKCKKVLDNIHPHRNIKTLLIFQSALKTKHTHQ